MSQVHVSLQGTCPCRVLSEIHSLLFFFKFKRSWAGILAKCLRFCLVSTDWSTLAAATLISKPCPLLQNPPNSDPLKSLKQRYTHTNSIQTPPTYIYLSYKLRDVKYNIQSFATAPHPHSHCFCCAGLSVFRCAHFWRPHRPPFRGAVRSNARIKSAQDRESIQVLWRFSREHYLICCCVQLCGDISRGWAHQYGDRCGKCRFKSFVQDPIHLCHSHYHVAYFTYFSGGT